MQWANITIIIRLGFSPFSSASSLSPDISKEKALEFLEVENELYKALQNFTAGDIVQPITRKSAATENRDDPFRVRAITFTTATEDDTLMKVNKRRVPVEITKQVL